jgi:hypothetical protein
VVPDPHGHRSCNSNCRAVADLPGRPRDHHSSTRARCARGQTQAASLAGCPTHQHTAPRHPVAEVFVSTSLWYVVSCGCTLQMLFSSSLKPAQLCRRPTCTAETPGACGCAALTKAGQRPTASTAPPATYGVLSFSKRWALGCSAGHLHAHRQSPIALGSGCAAAQCTLLDTAADPPCSTRACLLQAPSPVPSLQHLQRLHGALRAALRRCSWQPGMRTPAVPLHCAGYARKHLSLNPDPCIVLLCCLRNTRRSAGIIIAREWAGL